MDDMRTPVSVRLEMFLHRCRRRIRFFIGSRMPDAGIAWKQVNGGRDVPVCPRCGEYVYYADQCCGCGQHFLPGAVTIGEVMERGSEG